MLKSLSQPYLRELPDYYYTRLARMEAEGEAGSR